MKKYLIILSIILSSSAVMAAGTAKSKSAPAPKKPVFERQYGIAGCGLGSVVMGKQGGQVSAATTNGTSFNQSFGISAGSLNCLDTATAEVASRMDQFIIVNKTALQGDVAKWNGETISAISSYMGCSASSKEVGQFLKANYSTIFSKSNKANEITDSIITVILNNSELAVKCNNLG